MELRLAALIEAIFVIMGTPDTTVRQCPLALDKWLDLIVASRQRLLGLIVDTNCMTVGIPPDYVAEVLDLLNSLPAIGAHERQVFEKLLWGLVSSTISVRC